MERSQLRFERCLSCGQLSDGLRMSLFRRGDLLFCFRKGRTSGGHRRLQRGNLLCQRLRFCLSGGQDTLALLDPRCDWSGIDLKIRQSSAIFRIPDANFTSPVRTNDLGVVGRENSFKRQVAKRFEFSLLIAVRIPKSNISVT